MSARIYSATVAPTLIQQSSEERYYYKLDDLTDSFLQPSAGDQVVYISAAVTKLYIIKEISSQFFTDTYYECARVIDISGSGGGGSSAVVTNHTLIIG